MHVNFSEPGYEQRETIKSGTNAAKKGGYTSVMTMPNTNPSIDNKGMIEFIKIKQQDNIIDVYPAGNLTLKIGNGMPSGMRMAEFLILVVEILMIRFVLLGANLKLKKQSAKLLKQKLKRRQHESI